MDEVLREIIRAREAAARRISGLSLHSSLSGFERGKQLAGFGENRLRVRA